MKGFKRQLIYRIHQIAQALLFFHWEAQLHTIV